MYWGRYLEDAAYSGLLPSQRVNHFPGSLEIGHKGRLYAHLSRLRRASGSQVRLSNYVFISHSVGSRVPSHYF